MNNSTVKKAKHSTSISPLPVLACQFFKIRPKSQKLLLKSELYYPLHVAMDVAYSCLKY